MGTIPAPNIADEAGQIAAAPQNALAEYARVAQLKQATAASQQQQQQSAAMAPLVQEQTQQQIEAQRRQFADQDALTKAITQYDPDKHTLADVPRLVTQNGGSGQAALAAQNGLVQQKQNLAKLSDEQFAEEQKKADLIAGVHDQVSNAKPEDKQQTYLQGLQQLAHAGVDVSKEPLQYPGDDEFAKHLPAIRLHSAIVAEAEKDREISAKEQEAQAKATGAQTTATRLQAEMPGGSLEAPDKAELRSYLHDANVPGEKLPPSQRTPASFIAWKAKQSPMAMVMGNMLTPQALDQAAEKYHETGQIASGMTRSPGTIASIQNRAAQLHPEGELAANSAAFKANQSSLQSLQKNFDAVTAFENTAGRNLDTFLDQAKKVVDFGSPLVNMPLRKAASLAGSEDQAAFNAARTTALTEIAKVLNSSNASGVLSDSARHEVEGLIGPDASLKQIYSAANILKTDMANRHQSYQMQIGDIQKRLGAAAQAQPAAQGGGTIRARDPQGKLHEAPAGTALPQGWTLEK